MDRNDRNACIEYRARLEQLPRIRHRGEVY